MPDVKPIPDGYRRYFVSFQWTSVEEPESGFGWAIVDLEGLTTASIMDLIENRADGHVAAGRKLRLVPLTFVELPE